MGVLYTGCKKSEGGTGPGGGGLLGSGTVTASSSQGNLSFNGGGTWPAGAGPSVVAVYDTLIRGLQIVGYRQVSGSTYEFILIQFLAPGGVTQGSYPISDTTASFLVAYGIDTTRADSLGFVSTSGSITVTAASGTTATGNYSGNAIRLSDLTTVAVTGTFDVTYVRGLGVIQRGQGGGGGAISITVGSGTTPQYSWAGGNVTSVTLVRASNPSTPVWGIACNSGNDCISSPLTHGTVPPATTRFANTEPTLTTGIQYQVYVTRQSGAAGYQTFTP